VILVVTKTYPDIPLKKFLDEHGSYTLMEQDQGHYKMLEETIMKDWKNTVR
jgi:hypothetical protein